MLQCRRVAHQKVGQPLIKNSTLSDVQSWERISLQSSYTARVTVKTCPMVSSIVIDGVLE